MRKIKLIFGLFFLLAIITPAAAGASCNWRQELTTQNIELGTSQTTGGCLSDEARRESSNPENCTGTAPADTSSFASMTRSVCCCATDQNITVNAPQAKTLNPNDIFDWQVPIPNLKLSPVTCTDKCEIPWISEYIFGAYEYLLTVAAVLAVVILMAAGLLWIVSGGDASKTGQAKKMITGSVTGLLLLVGMSLLLNYINPNLAKTSFISLDVIQKKSLEDLAISRHSTTEKKYQDSGCATEEELEKGVEFYSTGYYKPPYNASDPNFWCIVAMQCTCPKGQDTTKNCDNLYGKTFPNYHPCNTFDAATPYCNMTSSGTMPKIGDIAGPKCKNMPGNYSLRAGAQVCFKGKTYTITDSGGGIDGKRIDIWSGDSLEQTYANTGFGTLTKGPCK